MLIAWLSSRASVALRAAGALLAGGVSIYCLIYVVALGVESAQEFRPTTIGLIGIFAVTAVSAVYAAFRSLRPRIPQTTKPAS
jgi:hypothetical protein